MLLAIERVRTSLRRLSKIWAAGSIVLTVGCGGGENDMSSSVETNRGAAMATLTLGPAQNYSLRPVLQGTTRMIAVVPFATAGTNPGLTISSPDDFFVAEDVISRFDALRIPIDIVACGIPWLANGLPGSSRMIVVVIDVRNQDIAMARQLGLVDLTLDPLLEIYYGGSCFAEDPPRVDHQRIHGLARRAYPSLFSGHRTSGSFENFSYRLYETGNYLGIKGDEVYVHNGRDLNFLYVGKIKDFIPYIDGISASAAAASESR